MHRGERHTRDLETADRRSRKVKALLVRLRPHNFWSLGPGPKSVCTVCKPWQRTCRKRPTIQTARQLWPFFALQAKSLFFSRVNFFGPSIEATRKHSRLLRDSSPSMCCRRPNFLICFFFNFEAFAPTHVTTLNCD